MRLAAYNIENLFDRPKAMNLDSWVESKSDDLRGLSDCSCRSPAATVFFLTSDVVELHRRNFREALSLNSLECGKEHLLDRSAFGKASATGQRHWPIDVLNDFQKWNKYAPFFSHKTLASKM